MTIRLVGWTLIHSLWQGGLIALALAAALGLTRRGPAGTRYLLSVLALLAALVLPVATAVGMRSPGARDVRDPVSVLAPTPGPPADATRPRAPDDAAPRAPAGRPALTTDRRHAPGAAVLPPRGEAPRIHDAARRLRVWLDGRVEATLPWLVAVWVAGVLLLSARVIGGVVWTRRLARDGTHPTGDEVRALASRLAGGLGVRAPVRVLEAARVCVPLVIGWTRPVILLPASLLTGLTPRQLEAILAHELAHIRRYDFVINLLQTVVETLLFYHPAVWWMSARIREEREQSCDEMAVAVCGGDRVFYSGVLLALEEWRGAPHALAAAATGGSLLCRVRRLLGREPAHIDLGPRWFAGVITVAAAVFTIGDATRVGAEPSSPGLPRLATPVGGQAVADTSRMRPDTVLRYPGDGPLDERWRWAEEQARANRFRSFWIAYVVDGDPRTKEWYYFDRYVPVGIGEGTMTGRVHFSGRDTSELRFRGVRLAPLVGNQPPYRIAIVLGFEASGRGQPRLARVHLGNFALPVHFHGLPLMWLGEAGDAESVEQVRRLRDIVQSKHLRDDLVAVVGAHQDSRAAAPPLLRWLENDREPESVRREAAQWLGRHPERAVLSALARTARADRSPGVRHESVEALEHFELEAAADTLMDFVRTLDNRTLRLTAIEALEHRTEPRVVSFLVGIVRDGAEMQPRLAAVESLANMEGGLGADEVVRLARQHPETPIRLKAVEEVANTELPAGRALDVLVEIAQRDADESVRIEAVETLAEVDDPRVVPALRDLAVAEVGDGVQRKAAEALGQAHPHEAAIAALAELAHSHPRADVQREAAEALGEFDDRRAVELLLEIVETHPDVSVQVEAAEALGEVHPHDAALAALRRVARTHPKPEVRRKAVEELGNYTDVKPDGS